MLGVFKTIGEKIKQVVHEHVERVREINRKYAEPRIKITPMVRLSLMFLRFYLIFLVIILIYKFITLLH